LGERVYFQAEDAPHGLELWVIDPGFDADAGGRLPRLPLGDPLLMLESTPRRVADVITPGARQRDTEAPDTAVEPLWALEVYPPALRFEEPRPLLVREDWVRPDFNVVVDLLAFDPLLAW
jgi:hypothetical protein